MLKSIAAWWFAPKSTDPALVFRERTIRVLVAVTLVLVILSLLTSVFLFRGTWQLISYPTSELLAAILLTLSFIAVQRRKVTMSGYFLVTAFFAASTFVPFLDTTSGQATAVNFYIISLVVVALVLPRRAIFLFGVISALLIVAILISSGTTSATASQRISETSITLAISSVLLYLLRAEFDSRLLAAEGARRETEQALTVARAARQEAEHANKAKSQFLANMSHELRTPLNAVIGYSEIILNKMAGPFSPAQEKLITNVHTNAKRLLGTINDVLDLSRVEAGRIEVRPEPLSPVKILTEIVESLRSIATQKKLSLETHFEPSTPETVIGDVDMVQVIVTNLLGNALKFTKEGSVALLTTARNDTTWEIQVQDTGIGIPANAIDSIFEIFQQADNTDTRKYQGSGLGLAIVKRRLEILGGSVQVQSTQGAGSTFTVTLPRTIALGRASDSAPSVDPSSGAANVS